MDRIDSNDVIIYGDKIKIRGLGGYILKFKPADCSYAQLHLIKEYSFIGIRFGISKLALDDYTGTTYTVDEINRAHPSYIKDVVTCCFNSYICYVNAWGKEFGKR